MHILYNATGHYILSVYALNHRFIADNVPNSDTGKLLSVFLTFPFDTLLSEGTVRED